MNTISLPEKTGDTAMQFALYFKEEWRPYFYLLWNKLRDGHICVPAAELNSAVIQDLFPDFEPDKTNAIEFISEGSVVRPVIQLNDKFYLHRYYYYETIILNKIKELVSYSPPEKTDLKKVSTVFGRPLLQDGEPDWQQVAAIASLQNNFTIITGGPGTGKTTTIATILQLLLQENPDKKVALAAPTGKAAARMAESLQEKASQFSKELETLVSRMEPSTIHRLLGSRKGSIHFKHNRQNPLNHDIIIIDESSMIDVALFAKLLDAVRPETQLILLGDKNQLASVEAGSLFGDLCNVPPRLNVFSPAFAELLKSVEDGFQPRTTDHPALLSDCIVELQKSYRFSSEAGIGRLSRIIINEDVKELENFLKQSDEVVKVDPEYRNDLFEEFILNFKSFIEEKDIGTALKKLNDCRVLCAVRDGYFGLYELNQRIESFLEKQKLIKCDRKFYENRPVIITRNNYSLNLFNGDSGIVRKNEAGELRVWFDINGKLTDFAPSLISGEETCFAITIHKSQGSEFDRILVLLPDYDSQILSKELVYTAITRARKNVLLQADAEVLKRAASRSVKRGSGLKERFQ